MFLNWNYTNPHTHIFVHRATLRYRNSESFKKNPHYISSTVRKQKTQRCFTGCTEMFVRHSLLEVHSEM